MPSLDYTPHTNQKTCAMPHCDGAVLARGLCQKHYRRLREAGFLPTPTVNERFDANVELIPFSTCHYWAGTLDDNGYGKLRIKGRIVKAHRYAFEREKGPIPPGLHVLHSCHVPCCVNPDHLRAGSHKDNMQDKMDAGRQALGSGHGRAKLTEDQVLAIRSDDRLQREIGNAYGISSVNVSRIKLRKIWSHI